MSPELTRRATCQFRGEVLEHIQVSAGLEALCRDYCPTLHLVQGVFEFVQTVGRVDANHQGADAGGRVLHHCPLIAVGSPDTDAVTRLYAQRQQAGGEPIDFLLELGIGPAHVLVPYDQRFIIGKSLADLIEIITDCPVDDLGA